MIKSELHLEYMYLNQKTFYKILQMKIVFFFFFKFYYQVITKWYKFKFYKNKHDITETKQCINLFSKVKKKRIAVLLYSIYTLILLLFFF